MATKPTISSPRPGARYLSDPSRSARYQALPLKGEVPFRANKVTWRVDGRPFRRVRSPFTVMLPLTPGEHRVQLVADGKASKEVVFRVD